MRVTIVKVDNKVRKDGQSHNIDLSDLDENIHAIQWYGSSGEVEYVDASGARNETITSFTPYQKYVDACNDGNKA